MPKNLKPKFSHTKKGGKTTNRLRIVGGEWGSRMLKFPDVPGLRPSSDRVRETLFNWLAGMIEGSRCLDLFCGSGALGLEALSRGAKQCDFVDTHKKVVLQMKDNLQLLNANQGKIWQRDAMEFVRRAEPTYDLIFLDPPFNKALLKPTIDAIEKQQLCHPKTYIYIEAESDLSPIPVPAHWHQLKHKKAGQLQYALYLASAPEAD